MLIAAYQVRHAALVGIVGRLLTKEKYSAKKRIPQFHKPLLIIHSKEDEEIPFAMGQRLFTLATASSKTFYAIDGGHILGPTLHADSIAQKISQLVK